MTSIGISGIRCFFTILTKLSHIKIYHLFRTMRGMCQLPCLTQTRSSLEMQVIYVAISLNVFLTLEKLLMPHMLNQPCCSGTPQTTQSTSSMSNIAITSIDMVQCINLFYCLDGLYHAGTYRPPNMVVNRLLKCRMALMSTSHVTLDIICMETITAFVQLLESGVRSTLSAKVSRYFQIIIKLLQGTNVHKLYVSIISDHVDPLCPFPCQQQ